MGHSLLLSWGNSKLKQMKFLLFILTSEVLYFIHIQHNYDSFPSYFLLFFLPLIGRKERENSFDLLFSCLHFGYSSQLLSNTFLFMYRYYEGGVSSVYLWEDDNQGFVACFLIKKGLSFSANVISFLSVIYWLILYWHADFPEIRWVEGGTWQKRILARGFVGCYSCNWGKALFTAASILTTTRFTREDLFTITYVEACKQI